MSRPMQISPPRVTTEVHDWLTVMAEDTGLSVALIAGELLDRARLKGWKVEPPRVTEPPEPALPYQIRPGRPVIVARDLSVLKGPASGKVELPLNLFWSLPDRTFDLDDPANRRTLYEIVLQEAATVTDLASYLNRDILVALWPQLRLPRRSPVRRAWEDRHPVLRPAEAAA